jgi:hypothetical protein
VFVDVRRGFYASFGHKSSGRGPLPVGGLGLEENRAVEH